MVWHSNFSCQLQNTRYLLNIVLANKIDRSLGRGKNIKNGQYLAKVQERTCRLGRLLYPPRKNKHRDLAQSFKLNY